jgi:hypothetical protein
VNLAWIAPAVLALGALILGPILAHMARQKPTERVPFGAMMLLRRLEKRLERRRRLRDLLLMLLRVLAIAALVTAAARPELNWPGDAPEFGGTGAVVLVVDDSMSMAQQVNGRTLMARARADALSIVDDLPEGTRVGLVRMGGRAERLTPTLSTDHQRVVMRLEGLEAGYGRTDLVGALHEARALLGGEPGEVLVFTDQAGPGVVPAARSELEALIDRGSAVIPRVVEADPPRNVAIVSAEYGDGLEGGTVQVELANFGPDPVEVPVTVTLPDESEITAFFELEGEGRASERFTVPRTVPGGVAEAWVRDTTLELDDRRSFHLPRVGASRILVVDGDPGRTPFESEVYFLERALAPWGGSRVGVLPEVISPGGLRRLDPETHQVVFLANVEDPGASAGALTDFVRAGGGLVISVGKNVTAERYNEPLRDLLPAELGRARSVVQVDGVALELPDLAHPLFSPFSRGGRAAFGDVTAFRVVSAEPVDDATVLLRWEDGTPALIERTVGRGRVLLWTSVLDYDDAWSHGAVQSAYMPLIQRFVGYLGGEAGGGGLRAAARVDEPAVVRLPRTGLEPEVTGPDGQVVFAELVRGEELEVRFTPRAPGAYTIGIAGEPALALVAVNVAPEESDVRVHQTIAQAEAEISPELLQNTLELGPWALLLGVLALLLQAGVSVLGGRS